MGSKVNMVRQDGTILSATPEQADRLKLLGYKEEGSEERDDRVAEAGRDSYYSTTGQRILTGLEGGASSLTLGASDYGLDALGADTNERAKYNPGTRMGGEILGALLPLALGDGAGLASLGEEAAAGSRLGNAARSAVEFSPMGLTSKAAKAVVGEGGGFMGAAARGAFEGGVFGGTQAADHAQLNGDALTAETVMHGLGWGAIFGAGLGAAGEAVEQGGTKLAARMAAGAEKEAGAAGEISKVGEEAYGALHSEVKTAHEAATTVIKQADAMVHDTLLDLRNLESPLISGRELAQARTQLSSAYLDAAKAVKAGKAEEADLAVEKFSNIAKDVGDRMGIQGQVMDSAKSLQELNSMRALTRETGNFPKDVGEFRSMTPDRANRLFAALQNSTKMESLGEHSQALSGAVDNLSKALGADSTGVFGLQSAWKSMKGAEKAAGAAAKEGPGWGRKILGTAAGEQAGAAVRKHTGSMLLGFGAYKAVKNAVLSGDFASSLLGAQQAVLGRVKSAVANFAPKAGRALQRVGPRVEPLAVKLDGTLDTSTKDRRELAARRIDEVRQAAPTAADTLFRAIQPIGATQPALAPTLHKAAVSAFSSLLEMVPKDPGAISRLKSLYKPDESAANVLSRQLAVFHDPVSEVESMLSSGKFDPIKIQALQKFAPEVYTNLRVQMLEKVTDPKTMDKMSYDEQAGMSIMLDIPIHSSFSAPFIASQQQIFTQRNQPNATPKINVPGQSGGGGPANNKDSTASQRITEH